MNLNTQRTFYVLLVFLIMSSLACLIDLVNSQGARDLLGDPIVNLPTATSIYDLTDEKEAEFQDFMGTSQTELLSVEPVPYYKDCPPDDVVLSPNAEVKYEIQEDTLTVTDALGSRKYDYSPHVGDRFWRDLPDGFVESISFDTINGVRVSNLRRYRSGGDILDPESLCYDQYTRLNAAIEDQSVAGVDSTLVEQCIASPDIYKIEFTNNRTDVAHDDSWQSCKADYSLSNFSAERLIFLTKHVLDGSSDGYSEKWLYFPVDPDDTHVAGSTLNLTYVDSPPGISTYSEVIIFFYSEQCANLFNDETISLWSKFTIPLADPCN